MTASVTNRTQEPGPIAFYPSHILGVKDTINYIYTAL